MLGARVTGQAEIRHVQRVLTVSPQQMRKDMVTGTRRELQPLKREIPAQAVARMPSGYGPLLARSIKVVTKVSGSLVIKASVDVRGQGKREERDVRAMNLGRLRHPLPRNNRTKWYVTRVRPGFITDPIDDGKKRVVRVVINARDKMADQIVRG